MFAGHLGAGLILKRVDRSVGLGTLFPAAMRLDAVLSIIEFERGAGDSSSHFAVVGQVSGLPVRGGSASARGRRPLQRADPKVCARPCDRNENCWAGERKS